MWLFVSCIEKARNNFPFIISAHEFPKALKVLPRHARDQREWDGGKCTFHSLKVCSCGKCGDDAHLKCDGKDYHTRHMLKCPMHSLAYEIECHQSASMSEQIVHPILKRGHSNWLEASQCFHTLSAETHPPGEASLYLIHRTCTYTESVDHSIIGLLNCSDVWSYQCMMVFTGHLKNSISWEWKNWSMKRPKRGE